MDKCLAVVLVIFLLWSTLSRIFCMKCAINISLLLFILNHSIDKRGIMDLGMKNICSECRCFVIYLIVLSFHVEKKGPIIFYGFQDQVNVVVTIKSPNSPDVTQHVDWCATHSPLAGVHYPTLNMLALWQTFLWGQTMRAIESSELNYSCLCCSTYENRLVTC